MYLKDIYLFSINNYNLILNRLHTRNMDNSHLFIYSYIVYIEKNNPDLITPFKKKINSKYLKLYTIYIKYNLESTALASV